MGNLKNYNFNKMDMYLSNFQYYDYYLTLDELSMPPYSDDCFVVNYDFIFPFFFLISSTIIFKSSSTSFLSSY